MIRRIAFYAGSFDPLTNGHLDVLKGSLAVADEIFIGIGVQASKQPLFSFEERVALIEGWAKAELGEDAARHLFSVVAELRRAGIRTDIATGGRGLKGAMKAADRSGARLAIVAGERDLAAGVAQLKDLHSGDQRPVPLAELASAVRSGLRGSVEGT
jgi:cytidyltransferase-like protein